jgi:hypothetical protein
MYPGHIQIYGILYRLILLEDKMDVEQLAHAILRLFKGKGSRIGDVLIPQDILNFQMGLNSSEREIIDRAIQNLVSIDAIRIVDRSMAGICYELTQKGYNMLF